MATVVYLPSPKFVNSGSIPRDKSDEKEAKAAKLAELFGNLNKEDSPERTLAIQQNIKDGAIESEGGLLSLITQMRTNKGAGNIKIDAFDSTGNKVPFAVNKNDLATGAGEANANKIGLTLTNRGKQRDYYENTPNQKFVGSSSGRLEGKITLDEWKSKFTKKGKPTDKTTAIGDYLSSQKLPVNAINRTRAREFLFNRSKATEVINSAFGKKTGADWTIDDPLKNQMAIIAKMQVEGFIMSDGTTAEQAGGQAVALVKELFKDKIADANAPIDIPSETEGGLFSKVKSLFSGDDEKSADEVRKLPTYIGDLNNIPIEIPENITSPAEGRDYIMKTYKISREDATQFLLDNAPTE